MMRHVNLFFQLPVRRRIHPQPCHLSTEQSWVRSAKRVKDTESTTDKHLNYLETIRATHDPILHVKSLEDELMGTMGAALGKQADKINQHLQQMDIQKKRYHDLCQQTEPCILKLKEIAIRHNEFREAAKTARWELLVHRQAVGFIINNHNVVHEMFPIGEPLPLDPNDQPVIKEEFNKYGDQKDWWERVGRWK